MEMTASDIIDRAMTKARIISPGEATPANKVYQVFAELNDMLESWSLEDLMIVYDTLEFFTLVNGKEEYTYGPGGDFDSVRPTGIKDESFTRNAAGVDSVIGLHSLAYYRRKRLKNAVGPGAPMVMAYHPEYPLGKIFIWHSPDVSTGDLHMRVTKQLINFADLTTQVDLEPGWSRALIANLAVEISLGFGKKVSVELASLAAQSKQFIKSANSASPDPSTLPDLQAVAAG